MQTCLHSGVRITLLIKQWPADPLLALSCLSRMADIFLTGSKMQTAAATLVSPLPLYENGIVTAGPVCQIRRSMTYIKARPSHCHSLNARHPGKVAFNTPWFVGDVVNREGLEKWALVLLMAGQTPMSA